MRYLENGHVTHVHDPPGTEGEVYVFGTTEPNHDEKILSVMQWTSNGTGGDRRGRLLTVQSFDDGRCSQNNSTPESQFRLSKWGLRWCETDIKLPESRGSDSYTLYWIWRRANEVDEYYTTCSDIDIQAELELKPPTSRPAKQDLHSDAFPTTFLERLGP